VRRRKPLIVAIVLAVILLGAAMLRFSPLWPGPAIPAHASRLRIATEAPHLVPALGCQTALLGPVRVSSSGDELIAVSTTTGEPVQVVWPSGYVAWRIGGHAELVARDGSVLAREGDVIQDRFAGGVSVGNAFHVCIPGE
jgi:hypothetical protein